MNQNMNFQSNPTQLVNLVRQDQRFIKMQKSLEQEISQLKQLVGNNGCSMNHDQLKSILNQHLDNTNYQYLKQQLMMQFEMMKTTNIYETVKTQSGYDKENYS